MPGVRVKLISKDAATPYSGMLPGLIAGHYSFDDAHIEMGPLCEFAGAEFCQAAVTGLDLSNRRIRCDGGLEIGFDLLSINTGSTPGVRGVPGATEFALPVKPIDRFLQGWEQIANRIQAAPNRAWRIAIVGGGAGGVEVALAVQYRLMSSAGGSRVEFHLVTDAAVILPTHNERVREKFTRILRERGVQVHLNHRVIEVKPDGLVCSPGETIACDAALWVTTASAPPWIGESGLQTDADGFVALNDCLQSFSHPFVFAAGDVAAVVNHPRPKSGVFAVRQGPPLTNNLRRALHGEALLPFHPQTPFLSLISTGDRYAVASRGDWALEGKWVWRWKNWIDRRWIRRYRELPARM